MAWNAVRQTRTRLTGGLDSETPPVEMPPGRVLGSLNYEESPERGYRRIDGYERFDGHPSPSGVTYAVLDFENGSVAISDGDVVDGATSGASGIALIDAVVESGSYGGGDAAGYLVLYVTTAGFVDTENLQVSAVTRATADGTEVADGAGNDTDDRAWGLLAITEARGLIAAIPGSGPIRGVFRYAGTTYAFRDNAGATAGILHKSSATGWTTVTLGEYLAFTSGGTDVFERGDTVTGLASGATATVDAVVLTGGSWAGGDAVGRLYISGRSGNFMAEMISNDGIMDDATIAAGEQTVTLNAGGQYDFVRHNFYATDRSGSDKIYGASGVDYAFEFDGTTFAQISVDVTGGYYPTHIAAHRQHLLLGYEPGSVLNSATGDPLNYTALWGSLETGTGDILSGFRSLPGGVLAIFGQESIYLLYGTDASNWELRPHGQDTGAKEWTVQVLGSTGFYLHQQGITTLGATDAFGDFLASTASKHIKRYITPRVGSVTASTVSRAKNQYRLFFDHLSVGEALYCTVLDDGLSIMPVIFPNIVRCIYTDKDSDGTERTFFGSDDGFIYELDKGNSYDGAAVDAFLRLPFNNIGSPEVRKHFYKTVLEVVANDQATILFLPEYDYGSAPAAISNNASLQGGVGYWDVSAWHEFVWASESLNEIEASTHGNGRNMALLINSESTDDAPHTIYAATVHYQNRRRTR